MQKTNKLSIAILLVVVAVFFVLRSEGAGKRRLKIVETSAQSAQGASSKTGGDSAAAPKPSPAIATKSVTPSPFDQAVSQNLQFRDSLGWAFGGKSQRGWALYSPLIVNLTGCESEAPGREFAQCVSEWQKARGFESTGVLDSNTWSEMISLFQSRRMKQKNPADPSELITIPISDCYDPERPEELRKVERETFAAYKRMMAAAVADPSLKLKTTGAGTDSDEKYLKIISAYRSREYQEQLRKQSPNSGRAGLAVNSPHFTGRALDLYVGGEPVNTKDENRSLQTKTTVYRWLVKNAARFGFQPYFYEPWHWEYVGTSNLK
jgi:zinc D-Ala-D-Ala carboxypeptidase